MFSFLRLLDGSVLVGEHVADTETTYEIHNPVKVDSNDTGSIEQRYHFAGMHCPFIEGRPLVVHVNKSSVISINKNLDSALERHYNRYINKWFEARDNYFNIPSEEEYDDPSTEEELEEVIDTLQAMVQSSNNTIH